MSRKVIWHERPVVGPLLYGVSSFVTGSLAYGAGYLLTNSILQGVYAMLFMVTVLALYLVESHRCARRRRRK